MQMRTETTYTMSPSSSDFVTGLGETSILYDKETTSMSCTMLLVRNNHNLAGSNAKHPIAKTEACKKCLVVPVIVLLSLL